MSLNTWKEEFYPVAADAAKGDALAAVDHSLKKWEGLRAENLTKHSCSVTTVGSIITDVCEDETTADNTFEVNCESCALCKYNDTLNQGSYCDSCPITLATGVACDDVYGELEEDDIAPWDAWTMNENPEPMIAVLNTTREWLLGQRKEQDDGHEER